MILNCGRKSEFLEKQRRKNSWGGDANPTQKIEESNHQPLCCKARALTTSLLCDRATKKNQLFFYEGSPQHWSAVDKTPPGVLGSGGVWPSGGRCGCCTEPLHPPVAEPQWEVIKGRTLRSCSSLYILLPIKTLLHYIYTYIIVL